MTHDAFPRVTAARCPRPRTPSASPMTHHVLRSIRTYCAVMGTALLVYTVLESAVNSKAVTTASDGSKQNLAPIPIGLAVFCAHIVLIPITGCSINPTRSFGPSVVAGNWDNHWVWWVGPLTGALVASFAWLGMQLLDAAPPPISEAKLAA